MLHTSPDGPPAVLAAMILHATHAAAVERAAAPVEPSSAFFVLSRASPILEVRTELPAVVQLVLDLRLFSHLLLLLPRLMRTGALSGLCYGLLLLLQLGSLLCECFAQFCFGPLLMLCLLS